MTFDLDIWPLTSSTNEGSHVASMPQLWLKSIKACGRKSQMLTLFHNRQQHTTSTDNNRDKQLLRWEYQFKIHDSRGHRDPYVSFLLRLARQVTQKPCFANCTAKSVLAQYRKVGSYVLTTSLWPTLQLSKFLRSAQLTKQFPSNPWQCNFTWLAGSSRPGEEKCNGFTFGFTWFSLGFSPGWMNTKVTRAPVLHKARISADNFGVIDSGWPLHELWPSKALQFGQGFFLPNLVKIWHI